MGERPGLFAFCAFTKERPAFMQLLVLTTYGTPPTPPPLIESDVRTWLGLNELFVRLATVVAFARPM